MSEESKTGDDMAYIERQSKRAAFREANRERLRIAARQYYAANKDAINARVRADRLGNPEKFRLAEADWARRNRPTKTAQSKRWRENNKEKASESQKRKRAKHSGCPIFRRHAQIRAGISQSIRRANKERKWTSYVGYTYVELKARLESMFHDGMCWENYGQWEIDHIRPISSFVILSLECEEMRQAWDLSNLQPLWSEENQSKGTKYDPVAD